MELGGKEAMRMLTLLARIRDGYAPNTGEIQSMREVTALYLSDEDISEKDLTELYRLEGLETLDISDTPVCSLEPLRGLKRLRELNANSTYIHDLTGLQELSQLEELDVSYTGVCSLEGLGALQRLRSLDLYATELRTLEGVGALSGLEYLNIGETDVCCLDGLAQLLRLKALRVESLSLCGLEELRKLPQLEILALNGAEIQSLDGLGALGTLRQLELSAMKITALPGLENLRQLRWLDIGNTGFTSLREIGALSQLETLDVSGTPIDSLAGIERLQRLCRLDASNTNIQSLEDLGVLEQLESLDVSETKIRSLKGLARLPRLTFLNISNTQIQSLAGISALEQLETLYAWGGELRSLSGVEDLRCLRELHINRTKITGLTELGALKRLEVLSAQGSRLRSLRGSKDLPFLRKIDISSTEVADLTELGVLERLETLDVSWTGVGSLAGLQRQPRLRELDISETSIRDLDGIERLDSLQELSANQTEITDLEKLRPLRQLKGLHIDGNSALTSLSGVEALRELRTLDVRNTAVASLEPVRGLENLYSLDISGTKISALEALTGLRRLRKLDISYLHLHHIPGELLALGTPFYMDQAFDIIDGIYLEGTTIATQPVSLFEQPRELIQAYYDAPKETVREIKVIFLGYGDVGKTYTIERILNGGKRGDYSTNKTPGINIRNYHVPDKDFNISFWDFGGQEIMHAMHRCFLTSRTCYVVMVNNRMQDLTDQARYWLRNIDSFAKGCPVVLAVNLWDESRQAGLDTGRLHKEFQNLQEVVFCSSKCSSEAEFARLTKAIVDQAENMDSCGMEFPKQWEDIRRELQAQAQGGTYYIDKAQYYEICLRHGLDDPNIRIWLLEWFNDLGICFSYHQDAADRTELAEYKVLNPAWLTNAIYRIINYGGDLAVDNVISRRAIELMLEKAGQGTLEGVTYTPEETVYILEVMRKFKLSYGTSPDKEFIPALCPDETPKDLRPAEWDEERHLIYEMKYAYLPDTVVHQLMIGLSANLNMEKVWQKGLCVELSQMGLSAVVDMGAGNNTLRIDIYAQEAAAQPWMLLQWLRREILRINSSLNLKAQDFIVIPGEPEPFSVDKILRLKERGKQELQGENDDYRIDAVLGKTYGKTVVSMVERSAQGERRALQSGDLFDPAFAADALRSNHFSNCVFVSVPDGSGGLSAETALRLMLEHEEAFTKEVLSPLIEALCQPAQSKELQTLGNEMKREEKPLSVLRKWLGDAASAAKDVKTLYDALQPAVAKMVPLLPVVLPFLQQGVSQV